MTREVYLTANARRDFARIEAHYDPETPHQTVRFRAEVVAMILARISERPRLPAVSRFGLRRMSTGAFPFHVWYRYFADSDTVRVVAILHQGRGPAALAARRE